MADVISHVADGIATAGWVYFVADFNLSSKSSKSNIFFRPEEAMLETGNSLSSKQILFCVWEETYSILYKQNEKHPLT